MSLPDKLSPPCVIGVLGAARIAAEAITRPAAAMDGVRVGAIAARDHGRAQRWAADLGIPTAYGSYDQLIEDPSLDAIYIAAPNAVHGQWAIKALHAGKHVLIEKPVAANAQEASAIVAAASETGLVAAEAFHYRYHPLMQHIIDLIARGDIGDIESIDGRFCCFLRRINDVRWKYSLGGGAVMDLGCYLIHFARSIVGEEPVVTHAKASRIGSRIDRRMTFTLSFPSSVEAKMLCSLCSLDALDRRRQRLVTIQGSDGLLEIDNPITPHELGTVRVTDAKGTRWVRVPGKTTYTHQLEAFLAAINGDGEMLTMGDDLIGNMAIIDTVYQVAGMPTRQPL